MGALRRKPCRRREREDGYVLATAVALMFITILTVMSVITVQLANIAGTRRAAGQLEGRAGGDRALDQAFNALQAASKSDPSVTLTGALSSGQVTVSTSINDTWYWYDATTLALCSASSTTCVHFSAEPVGTTDYILEVTARTQCRGGTLISTTGALNGGSCVVSKYQQRIRKKQFFDYLSVTNTETSPFSSAQVAYVPGDVIRGPIRSNGTFYVCATATATAAPNFQGSVESGASSTFANPSTSSGACVATANRTPTQRPQLGLPKSTTTFTAIPPSFGETVISSCLSASPGCTPLEVELLLDANGNAQYRTRAMNSQNWGSAGALPASRVLVVNGDVLVHGTLGNRLTIATVGGGNILINGDLLYKCLKNGWTTNPGADTVDRRTALRNLAESGAAAPTTCSDEALGLVADQDIRIICGATAGTLETAATADASGQYPTTPACIRPVDAAAPETARSDAANRYMVGAWMAVNGKIVTERWATGGKVGASTSVPNLYYYGSMTSQNRGVFGLEILSSTRDERGLTKKFRWDETMKDRQPPYFLEPTNETWERVDLVEVAPCGAGLFGQKPQGAGC